MILTEDPIICCNKCRREYQIPKEWFDGDSFCIGEGGMGEEIQHDIICEIACENCGNRMYVKIRGYEYPVGAKNYQDSEVDGCEIIYEPSAEMEYYDFDIPENVEEEIAFSIPEILEQIRKDTSFAYRISSRQFEKVVAEVFRRAGYYVELTPAVKDGGKDIIATKNDNGIPICLYVECKQFDPENPVGVGIVRSASGVRGHDKVNKAIVVTTSRFTRGAFEYAREEEHLIQLMDLNDLLRMIG